MAHQRLWGVACTWDLGWEHMVLVFMNIVWMRPRGLSYGIIPPADRVLHLPLRAGENMWDVQTTKYIASMPLRERPCGTTQLAIACPPLPRLRAGQCLLGARIIMCIALTLPRGFSCGNTRRVAWYSLLQQSRAAAYL